MVRQPRVEVEELLLSWLPEGTPQEFHDAAAVMLMGIYNEVTKRLERGNCDDQNARVWRVGDGESC